MFVKSGVSGGRACVLFLLLLSVLAGCHKNAGLTVTPGQVPLAASAESAQPGILTGVYRGEELIRPEGVYVDVSHLDPGGMRFDGETGDVTFWAMGEVGKGVIMTVNGENVTKGASFDIPEDRIVQTAAFGEHGFVWVTAIPADHKFAEEELNLLDLDTQEGKTVSDVRSFFAAAERSEADFGRFQITSSAIDADGDIWLAASGEVVVLSPDGVFLNSFVSHSYSAPLTVSPEGKVWVSTDSGIAVLDKKNGEESVIRLRTRPSAIVFGEGYDFYFETEQGVYGYDGTGSVLLMNFENSNMLEGGAGFCGVIDPETLLFASDESWIAIYRSLGEIDLSTIPTIQVAFNALSGWYSMEIVEYNKAHPETRVIVTDYTKYNTDADMTRGAKKLATDMITGLYKPDIVIAQPRSYFEPKKGAEIEMMIEHKLYADLSGFLENDPDLSPDKFFGAVRRYFTAEDGGMWGISSGFQVSTLFGPTALLEKWSDGNGSSKGWTLTEMLDFAESLPKDSYLIGTIYRQTAANRLLGPDGYAAFIDRESVSCSFDGPDFLRWLRFLTTLRNDTDRVDSITPDTYGLVAETAEAYYTGRVALEGTKLWSTGEIADMECQFATKDWTIIGFPAEGYNGSYVQCDSAILMTSFCADREFAWDVIRMLVTGPDSQIPILKQNYEKEAAEYIEENRYMILTLTHDEGGFHSRSSGRIAEDGNFPTPDDLTSPGWISIPTEEDFARLEAFLDNDAGYPLTERVSPEITDIISEEISTYYAGVGSAEDCARKIQSRVSIWLAEHR